MVQIVICTRVFFVLSAALSFHARYIAFAALVVVLVQVEWFVALSSGEAMSSVELAQLIATVNESICFRDTCSSRK